MKISKILPFVTVALLASCAGNKGNTTSGGNSSNKVSFQFWHTLGQGLQDGLNDAIAEFQDIIKENEGVEVEVEAAYQGGYDDIENKISSGLAAGNIPSVAVAYPDHVANYLAAGTKYVANLDNYMDNDDYGFGTQDYLGDFSSTSESGVCDKNDIVEAFFEEGQQYAVEGTYSLPWMKSSEIMFYNLDAVKRCFNTKLLDGATFDPEVVTEAQVISFMNNLTWDEFINLARFAKDHKDKVLPNMIVPIQYDSDSNMFISKLYQENIEYSSVNNGKGVIDFETGAERTKAEAMAVTYANYVKDGLLQTRTLAKDGKYSSDFLTNEELMFGIGSSGGAGYNAPSADAFTYKICRVPASNHNPLYVSQGPTLTLLNNADAKKTEYAWKFMKFLTNTETNEELCVGSSQGYIPVRKSCYDTDYFAQFLADESIYSDSARILINDIAGSYLTTATFKGSDVLRDQVGTIVPVAYGDWKTNGTAIEAAVKSAFDNAINETKKKL